VAHVEQVGLLERDRSVAGKLQRFAWRLPREAEVLRLERIAAAAARAQIGAFDLVAQLAHVPGPRLLLQQGDCGRGHGEAPLAVDLRQEAPRERADILGRSRSAGNSSSKTTKRW